jgi:8-oxo-dGTP diphosphatase
MSKPAIRVVAGIIYDADQTSVLLALRKPDQHQGNCWEFPGGKIEADESKEDALARELFEELNINPTQFDLYADIAHEYADKNVHLYFYQVTAFSGEPKGRENQQIKWFALEDIATLEFPAGNKPVLAKLVAEESSNKH